MMLTKRVYVAALSFILLTLTVLGLGNTANIHSADALANVLASPTLAAQGGSLVAEPIFTAAFPIVALAVDGDGLLYVLTYDGEILKVSSDGTSTSLAAGLSSCSFSSYALVVLPDGSVIANSCADDKDILVKIDPAGNQTTLAQLEGHVLSMASDASGSLYVGTWSSEGDLTVMFDPSTYLAAAVNMWGQISLVDSTGVLTTVYEGGFPLALHVSEKGDLYAAVWGQSGGFSSESKSYSVCDPRNFFWITLSEQVQIQQISNGQALPVSDQLDATGSLASQNGLLFAYGFPPDQACGIYRIEQGQPQRLSFTEEGVDESLTGIVISSDILYFSDVDGNVYRVSLEGQSVGTESKDAAIAAAPVPSATAISLPTQTTTPTPAPTVTPALPLAMSSGPVQVSIASISVDDFTNEIVFGILTSDPGRITRFELELRDTNSGIITADYAQIPPPFDAIRIPLADVAPGRYTAFLRAYAPDGSLLAEASPLSFEYSPLPTVTPMPLPTVSAPSLTSINPTPTLVAPPPDTDGDGIPDPADACPSQGDTGYGLDTTGCPNPAPQQVQPQDNGKVTALSETYTTAFDMSLDYPTGWVIQENDSSVYLGNSQDAINVVNSGSNSIPGGFVIAIYDSSMILDIMGEVRALPDILTTIIVQPATQAGWTTGEIMDTPIGDYSAVQVHFVGPTGEVTAYVIDYGNGQTVLVTAVAAEGELSTFEPVLESILASVRFPSAAAPVSQAESGSRMDPISAANASRVEKIYAIGGGENRFGWRISPNGTFYANIDETHSPFSSDVTIYNSQTGAVQSHIEGIHDFAFSPDEKLVAFVGEDKTALADLQTGTVQTILDEEYRGYIAFSPDGTLLAADGWSLDSPQTVVWDMAAGAVQVTLDGSFPVAFSPDNKLLTCRADNTTAEVWSIHAGKAEAVLAQNQPQCGSGNLLFSPDGALLAGWSGAQIVVWDVKTGAVQANLQQTGEVKYLYWSAGGHTVPVAFSPDGALLASVDGSTIRLWDVRTGAVQAVLARQASDFDYGNVAFSPDGRFLAFSGNGQDVYVYVWDIQTGSLTLTVGTDIKGLSLSKPAAFAFSPDSTLLAVASNFIPLSASGVSGTSGIQLLDLQTGQALAVFEMTFQPFQTSDLLLFSRDGTSLVAAPDGQGKLQVFGLIASSVERRGVKLTGEVFWKFSDVIPSTWLAVDPIPARYELRFQDHSAEAYTCSYIGNNQVVYYQQVITVTITDLQTNEQVASRTFSGADSGTCPATQEFAVGGGITLAENNEADASEFEAWVKGTLSAYGLN